MSHNVEPAEAAAGGENLEDALNAAMASENYLVAVWRVEDGRVYLFRESHGFPEDDFETAQVLLARDLATSARNNLP